MLELQQLTGNQGGGNTPRRPQRDVFSQLLGEGWEAQGDGTYRFVGIDRPSPDAVNPERSTQATQATRDVPMSKRSDEAERAASTVERRKRGLWRKR